MDITNYKERKKNGNVKFEKRGNKIVLLTAKLDLDSNEKTFKEQSIRSQQIRAKKDTELATIQSNISNAEQSITELQDRIEQLKLDSKTLAQDYDFIIADIEKLENSDKK